MDLHPETKRMTSFGVVLVLTVVSLGQFVDGATLFNCNFDTQAFCNMIQDHTDQFDWLRRSGHTPTGNTGPSSGQGNSQYYIYAETSVPQNPNDETRITTGALNYVGDVCVDFYYHMYGNDIGMLRVYRQRGEQYQPQQDLWMKSGDQGNAWKNTRTDISLTSLQDRIGFTAVKGRDYMGDIAIDTITISTGRCDSSGPGEPDGLPFSCDFEDNAICSMRQSVDDQFDWTRHRERTPSSNTGPQSASSNTYYMYIETSDPRKLGDTAKLETPQINYEGDVCVRFKYHMYGNSVGRLSIYTTSRGAQSPVQTYSGNKGDTWLDGAVTVNIRNNDRIGFLAERGDDIEGDIAIDEVDIKPGRCDGGGGGGGETGAVQFTCDFEDSFICSMRQSGDDQFDWTRNRDGTPSSNTGPSRADSGTYYMYIETSDPRQNGDTARLESPIISYSGDSCVRFMYHMYGSNIGSLSLYTMNRGVQSPFKTYTGDKGNTWHQDAVTVTLSGNDRIGFLASRTDDIYGDIAIDKVTVTQGRCEGGSTGELPFICSFENDFCKLRQRTNDNFDWLRFQGRTATSDTGPDAARSGVYYMYTEASSPRVRGDKAYIETTELRYTGDVCIMFDYHMYGTDIGTLYVYTTNRGENNPVFRQTGDKGNQWLVANIDAYVQSNSRVVIVGERGNDIAGDIAIDNLLIAAGRCSGSVTTTTPRTTTRDSRLNLPFRCGFEYDYCSFAQRQDDQFDWTRQQGQTGTDSTGPTRANSGQFYAYIEASSPRVQSDKALLETPELGYNGDVCLKFYYNMYGDDIGRLLVYTSTSGQERPVFSESGNKGEGWRSVSVNLYVQDYQKIIFMGERANDIRGDIAIDDVQIIQGRCGADTTTTPRSTTTTTGTAPTFAYYTCDIERDGQSERGCRIRQDGNDRFDWVRYSGKTPSGSLHDRRINDIKYPITGPSSAVDGSYYLYLEASGRSEGDLARFILQGDQFSRRGQNCLRFSYNMNGYHIGDLRVYVQTPSGKVYKWVLYADQGADWHRAAVDLNLDSVSEVGFEGRVGTGFSGDIAIDSIQMREGPCESTPSDYLWRCNFETADRSATFCGMDQDSSDTTNFDWLLWRAGTPSEVTGPDKAYNDEYYVYIEASNPRREGDFARILVPRLNQQGDVCVEFHYHMYGFHIGSLEVFTRRFGSDKQTRWTKSGEQGNAWREARVTIDNLSTDHQIGFNAIRGGEYSGDIAIDNVRIRRGRC